MNNKILLIIAFALIVLGLIKPDMLNLPLGGGGKPAVIDVLELTPPTDENILKEANDVVKIAKNELLKEEAKRLRDLYLDMKQLVKLDGEDEVIKSTEEIRQANSLAGLMLRMDMKGKYPNLAKELKDVIVAAIGDDQIVLSSELRSKALDGFDALAWALNEGSK